MRRTDRAVLASGLLLFSTLTAGGEARLPAADDFADPMQPAYATPTATRASAVPVEPNVYVLQAIKIDGRANTALIDGRLVSEGMSIGPDIVLKISPAEVVIGTHEHARRLRLNPHDIKHPAHGRN